MRKQLKEVVKCVTEELRTNYSARTNDNELILGVMRGLGVDTTYHFQSLYIAATCQQALNQLQEHEEKCKHRILC